MNRRGFLGLLGAVTGAALIGELPSSKTFFLPPAGGWRQEELCEASFRKWVREVTDAIKSNNQFNDGVALISRAHPLSGWSNPLEPSDVLSARVLESIEIELAEPIQSVDPLNIRLYFGKQGDSYGEIEHQGTKSIARLDIRRAWA